MAKSLVYINFFKILKFSDIQWKFCNFVAIDAEKCFCLEIISAENSSGTVKSAQNHAFIISKSRPTSFPLQKGGILFGTVLSKNCLMFEPYILGG